LDQPVGRISQLRLYPIRPLWSLGSGWAAVCSGLAAGGLDLSPETLLKLLLAWLLVDPILGAVWDSGVGSNGGRPLRQRGIYQRLLDPRLPATAPALRLLPYTQVGSPGHRLARHLGRLRRWWQYTLWPKAGYTFATMIAGLGLALLLGAVLGRTILALVLISVTLSWLATLSQQKDSNRGTTQRSSSRQGMATLWHALGEFGVPWLIGATLLGNPSRMLILLGICYTITYFGLIRYTEGFRLIGSSQAAAALLLAGLRHPLAAGAILISLMPQWGLRLWATDHDQQSPGQYDHVAATGTFLRYVQPFVIMSMLLAVLALA
jgi:hypothetical protein